MSKFSSPVLPVTDGPLSTVLMVVYKELASKGILPLQLFFLLNFIKISKNIFFFSYFPFYFHISAAVVGNISNGSSAL